MKVQTGVFLFLEVILFIVVFVSIFCSLSDPQLPIFSFIGVIRGVCREAYSSLQFSLLRRLPPEPRHHRGDLVDT